MHGLCAFADETKVDRLIKEAEKERVVIVAIQEMWFKKKKFDKDMERALEGQPWTWYGNVRRRQKRKDKKGSGGTGFLVHESAGKARLRAGTVNGVMWLELETGGETTHVVNVYLVPADSPRIFHNDNALREFERIMACTQGARRVVTGDWNARIGERSSFVFTGEEDESGDAVVFAEKEYVRTSADKKANRARKCRSREEVLAGQLWTTSLFRPV